MSARITCLLFLCACWMAASCALCFPIKNKNPLLNQVEKATVFGMIDTLDHPYQFNWVKQFKIQVLVRGWMHFGKAVRQNHPLEWVIRDCKKDGILFSGGGVVNQLGLSPALLKYAEKKQAVGLSPWGKAEPSEGNNVYSGSLYSKTFLHYKLHYLEKQIDKGVNLIHLDVIVQLWDLNDKFDNPTIFAFRRFLKKKYPSFSPEDWEQRFDISSSKPWGGIHHFNYRVYLQNRRYPDGTLYASSPYRPQNPLAAAWGIPTPNYMNNWRIFPYEVFPKGSFMHKTVLKVSRYFAKSLKKYARSKGKNVLITFNGASPYADFQVDSGLIAYTIKKMTEFGIAEEILTSLRHNGNQNEAHQLKSLLASFLQNPLQSSYGLKKEILPILQENPAAKRCAARLLRQIKARQRSIVMKTFPLDSIIPDSEWIIKKSRKIIKNQKAPVVFFVDYPPPWQTLKFWNQESVRGFLTKLCAEIYSAGGRFAFMPDFLQSFPSARRSLQQMAVFIREHSSFYHAVKRSRGKSILQGADTKNFTAVLWKSTRSIKRQKNWILDVVNLNPFPANNLLVKLPSQIKGIKKIRFFSPSLPRRGILINRRRNTSLIRLPEFRDYGVILISD